MKVEEVWVNKIRHFFISNYSEILSVFSLFIIFSFLVFKFWHNCGLIIIDCGREASFPEQILKGKILYKDIFNIFGPLSYFINAGLYKVFGINLNVLRMAGTINALIIIFLLYSITRLFTSRSISWVVSVFIIITCFIRCFNFIFPYTYAATYALSAFLFSVLFLMLYLKTYKSYFIPLSWLFIGISMTSKADYFLYVIFLALLTGLIKYYKKIEIKYLVYSLLSFLIVPVISFLILFFQGLTINDLLSQGYFIQKYAFSKTLNHFYFTSVGTYFNINNLGISLKYLLQTFQNFLFVFTIFYLPLKFNKPLLYIAFIVIFYLFRPLQPYYLVFSWMPLFTLFLFIFMLINLIKTKNYKQDGIYLVLIIIALIASMKSFFFLNLTLYGAYTFPLLFIVISIFVAEYLSKWIKPINQKYLQQIFFVIFCGIILACYHNLNIFYSNMKFINNEKGPVGDSKSVAVASQQIIAYIEKNLSPEASLWVIPEGLMINFFTNHPSNGIYYNITPPYIDTFGEDKIVADTKKNPPDYIIINDRDSSEYSYKYICKDYGFNICKYIKSNYSPVNTSGKNFKMVLYKKKKIDNKGI